MGLADFRESHGLHRQDRGSIASQVYDLLLSRILDMELKPFDEMSEARLASEFGVSRTPVREALARLARRSLVDVYPQRGTLVSPISIRRVAKARFIRDALERPLARLAATNFKPDMAGPIEREIALQKTFAELGDHKSFMQSDDQFHALIANAAGYESIWEDVGEAKFHMDRVRQLSLLSKARMLHITEEHTAIYEAMLANDPVRAEGGIVGHLQSVFVDIEAIRAEHPEYFVDSRDDAGTGE